MNPFTQIHSLYLRRSVWTLALLGCAVTPLAYAKLVQEVVKIPMTVANAYGKEETRDVVVTVFVDNATPAPHPVMVLGHGRAPEPEKRTTMGRQTFVTNATWFTKMGFLVAVPTRIGYGVTGGDDLEDTGTCSRKNYPPGYAAAAVQTLKVLDAMRQRSDTAKNRAIIMGQSFGGTTAITVAAQNPVGVQATINFAGGGGGNDATMPQNPCAQPGLKQMFADYGKTARMPTLWVYTENDMYFGPKLPKEWFDAYKANGGQGEYVLFPPVGTSGHGLFTIAPNVWHGRVLEFLRANGYPELVEPAPVVKVVKAPEAPAPVQTEE
jgi:dienelactone hydrolase